MKKPFFIIFDIQQQSTKTTSSIDIIVKHNNTDIYFSINIMDDFNLVELISLI